MKTFKEIMELTSDIPANFHDGTFEMLGKYIPTLPAGEFLEFGTGLAKATCTIALLNPHLIITTFDTAEPYNFADYNAHIEETLKSHGVTQYVNHFIANSLELRIATIQFVGMYIDSGHSYELTLAELNRWVPSVKKGGIIILDDYLDTKVDVRQAVDEYVKENPNKVKVLEDTYMGFVMQKL